MQSAFLAISVYGLFYFLVQRRQFDFVSTGFLSQIIYFMPGYYGYVMNPYFPGMTPSIPIASTTYIVWIIAMSATIVTGMLYRPGRAESWPQFRTTDAFDFCLIGLIVLAFVAELYFSGGAAMSADKLEVLEGQTRFALLYQSATQVALISFLLQRKWIRLIIPGLMTLFALYSGFRSDLAIAIIAVGTYVARRNGVWTFARPRYLLLVGAIVVLLFTYKGLLFPYRAGRIDIFYTNLANQDFFTDAVLGSEPFLTQSILNEVIIRDLTMPPLSVLFSLPAAIPLFAPLIGVNILPARFDFQEQLFPNLSYGVASNIYAYFYTTLGWLGVILFIVVHCYTLVLVSRWLARVKGPVIRLGILAVGAFLAFYIYRNDLANTFSVMNRPIIALGIVWIMSRYLEWPMKRRVVDTAPPPR
jgi:hypothetical protein